MWLRIDDTNVVGKEKEDGVSESGRPKFGNVGVDVLNRYGSGTKGKIRRCLQ